jgi:predicted transcriptional regulator
MDDTIPELTSQIVQSFVENNKLPLDDLPTLIRSIHSVLGSLGRAAQVPEPEPSARATTSQIRKSLTPDALISFVDGRPYRMLKRHLSSHGLTPAAYREKFGLPADYPLVAASYAAKRSEWAIKSGLGRKATPKATGASLKAGKAPVAAKVTAKSAKAPRASRAAGAAADKAGLGAKVPKAKVDRPPKAIDPATDEFT